MIAACILFEVELASELKKVSAQLNAYRCDVFLNYL
jgi:hypothetical protein